MKATKEHYNNYSQPFRQQLEEVSGSIRARPAGAVVQALQVSRSFKLIKLKPLSNFSNKTNQTLYFVTNCAADYGNEQVKPSLSDLDKYFVHTRLQLKLERSLHLP